MISRSSNNQTSLGLHHKQEKNKNFKDVMQTAKAKESYDCFSGQNTSFVKKDNTAGKKKEIGNSVGPKGFCGAK
jgi:hypothetical protein